MFNLTRQEKSVLLFIASASFIGICINYLAKNNPRFKNYFACISRPSVSTAAKINLNKATADELITLIGIGPELARRIIDYRNTQGSFKAADDIIKVKGLGKQKFEQLKDKIIVEESFQ